MKKLGKVLHEAASHKLILRTKECNVKIGQAVYDESRRKIGVIYDIFGPVSEPYISIMPKVKDASKYVGMDVYVEEIS